MGTLGGLSAKEAMLFRLGVIFDVFEMSRPKEKKDD